MRMGPYPKLQMIRFNTMHLLSISYILKDLSINWVVWGTNRIIFHDPTVQEELFLPPYSNYPDMIPPDK